MTCRQVRLRLRAASIFAYSMGSPWIDDIPSPSTWAQLHRESNVPFFYCVQVAMGSYDSTVTSTFAPCTHADCTACGLAILAVR